jgi:tetratricopeptide (TPR) repeat protein
LANAFYRTEELDKSIDAYHLVLAGQPNDPLVSYNLAMAYRDKKKWAEGLNSLTPFLASGKSLPAGGHKLLGDLYRGSGDAQRALVEYERERSSAGESPDLASGMAQAAESLGQRDLAIERWRRVAELDPTNREARTRLRKLNQPVPGRRR